MVEPARTEPDARLSVNRTATDSGLPRTTILRYLEQPAIHDWWGFDGTTFPARVLPFMRALSTRRDDPRFKPKVLARTLQDTGPDVVAALLLQPDTQQGRTEDASEDQAEPDSAPNVPATRTTSGIAGRQAPEPGILLGEVLPRFLSGFDGATDTLRRIADALEAQNAKPAEDALLTLKEARESLGVPQSRMKQLPRVFGKVRRSDVLRLIERGE